MVPGRSWASLGGLWAVPGGAWCFLGGPWASLGGLRRGPGRSWGVSGGSLGGPWGTSWGAYRSLGGPGVSSGVHGGFLELVIFCLGDVNLLLVLGNIDMFDLSHF